MAYSWPPLWARTWRIITTSTPPGCRPVAAAAPARTLILEAPDCRMSARAAASVAGSLSTPMTCPAGPTIAEPGQQLPLPAGPGLRVPADQGREQRDERQGGRDDQRGHPVRERHPDQHGQRDGRGQHQLRQVPGKVGIQPVQSPGRERGDLPGLLTAEPARAQSQGMSGEPPPQPGLHRRRGAQRRRLPAAGRDGPPGKHHPEPGQRSGQDADPRPVRGAGQRLREQAGLRQDQPRAGQAASGSDRQVPTRRPGLPQQPRINMHGTSPSRVPARRGCPCIRC